MVVFRVGSTKPKKIDVRIISATNANINEKLTNKEFREDLYYRLNTIPITIPPLRDRKDEILDIANKKLLMVCKEYSLSSKAFSKEAVESLMSYEWPGNIRELLSVVERAAILSDNDIITKEDLFLDSRSIKKDFASLDKMLTKEVLEDNNYDIKKSAEVLGMSVDNLKRKIQKYNLKRMMD
jgi:DNA-binding NtrC family response regulator